ncbi:MAG TPA: hypothetical protein VIL57_06500 [Bacteroidia bacterium]
MKKLYSLLILFISCSILFAQEKGNITGKYYITDVDIKVKKYNLLADTVDTLNTYYIAKAGTKFTAYEIKKSEILIKFWNFREPNEKAKKIEVLEQTIDSLKLLVENENLKSSPQDEGNNSDVEAERYKNQYISLHTNGEYFLIDAKDFNTKTSEYFARSSSFAWGFSTLPIKLRFGGKDRPFEYSTGFSLGINAGYEYQFKSRVKQSIGILLGVGVSTVMVSPESTNSVINKSTTTGAFVPTLSLLYSYSHFQIGTFVGADFIPGEIGKNWVYRNSPWLGLGLGFTIFQRNKSDAGREPNQGSR